ncbi:MAG: hypothetical protein PHX72_00860 [Candidatus Shapirobacteria bacterium]|nr:hypothetical protein [Candidatus Shapirobacteria bacterium]
MAKIIKIGFDLDGVLARHYLDRFWFRMRKKKEKKIIATDGLNYFYPKSRLEKAVLTTINRLRKISSSDKKKIKGWSCRQGVEIYLVTGRFGFLRTPTLKWLEKNSLVDCFSKVFINQKNQDPVQFKSLMINNQGLDIFIDDDLEVLEKLSSSTKAKLFWLVPNWRQIKENGHKNIVAVNSIKEALSRIDSSFLT